MGRSLFVTILMLLLAACGSSGPTPDPNLTPAPAPDGWSFLSWTDPGHTLAVPTTWTTADPKTTNPPDPSLTPEQQLNTDFFNDMASGGHTRLVAYGDLATPLASVPAGAVYVFIETGDASLEAFGDREDQLDRKLIPGVTIDRTTVVIPVGVAIRMAYAGTIVGWPPFYEVDYLLRLPDGRSMTVAISGADKAANPDTVGAFAARVIWTLKPVP